jgi:hypothetical protein
MPIRQIIIRGLAAAHGALIGALFLFLLHAPAQVLGAVLQNVQVSMMAGPEQPPDPTQILLLCSLSFGSFVLALAVFFLFPLVQGGILGQVRDRLEPPPHPPGPFGAYGRAYYGRLLGSLGLFTLVMIVILLPVMVFAAALAIQVMAGVSAEGTTAPPPPDPQQLTRQLLSYPVLLVLMLIATFLMMAAATVYWVSCCVIVSEQGRVLISCRKALRFCRQNFRAVLAVWLLTFAVSALISPLGLVGQLGLIKELWALVALALIYAALIGYWGVLFAGLIMSLYLARRSSLARPERGLPVLAEAGGRGQRPVS